MRDLQKEFPAASRQRYFDTVATGLLSHSVMEWRRAQDMEFLLGGSTFRSKHRKALQRVKKQVSEAFSCAEENSALIPNFSFGIQAVFESLAPTSKILYLENDYPSLVWPLLKRGFSTVAVPQCAMLEEAISEALEKHRPDVFVCSVVQYLNGIQLDMKVIKELKQKYPEVLFIADGTQYLGTAPFSFDNSPWDVMLASGYKWLLGGFGNGLLMVREEAKKFLHPKCIGYNSVSYSSDGFEDAPFIQQFEPGHQDTLNYGSLGVSVRFLHQLGWDAVGAHLQALSVKAKSGFEALHLLEDTVTQRSTHSTIFSLQGGEKLYQFLRANQIVCSQRGTGVRVSFHVYNTTREVGNLLTVLDRYLKK